MTPSIDLSAETTLGWTEWGILIAIATIACLYLWLWGGDRFVQQD